MPDNRTRESRSALMSRIGARNTAPEIVVRKLLHRLGYRFRLHRKDLPGKPDIVLPSLRVAILVHGCFWHAHGCKIGRPPKSRLEFWTPKLARNRARDAANEAALTGLGWNVVTLWQCEIRDPTQLESRLAAVLNRPVRKNPIDKTKAEH